MPNTADRVAQTAADLLFRSHEAALDPLVDALLAEEGPGRPLVVATLRRIGRPAVRAAVARLATDQRPPVLKGLEDLGPETAPSLVERLGDDDPSVTDAAATVLLRLGEPAVVIDVTQPEPQARIHVQSSPTSWSTAPRVRR